MKRRYWIALAVCIVLIFGILVTGYKSIKKETERENRTESLLATQGDLAKEETFYLSELNGYVVVYQNDKKTIYEYTNIAVSDLPDQVKNEIRMGKEITSIQELYGFLENYSS